ncbi:MAG: hypothetical protein M1821_002076, partial [Bathelium mastoideum]
PAWNLFRVMHTYLLIGCLSMRVPPPEKSAQWLRQSYFTGPIEEECILMIEAVQIVSDVQGVALSCPEPLRSRKLYHILQQGIELDRKLTHWAGSLPSIWKYSSILNKSTSAAIPKCIHVHEDLFAAATWNNWRVVRIRLLQTLVAVAELVSEDERIFECHFLRWQKTIRDLADDVCSSTPYLLGEIDGQGVPRSVAKGVALGGYTLLHPLYVVISVRGLPASLYHWIEGKLTYIADVLGIGQANLVRKQHKMQIHFPVIGDVVSESERITPHLKGGQ